MGEIQKVQMFSGKTFCKLNFSFLPILLAKIVLFDLNLDLVFERIVKIIGLNYLMKESNDMMKESKDEGVVHDQT